MPPVGSRPQAAPPPDPKTGALGAPSKCACARVRVGDLAMMKARRITVRGVSRRDGRSPGPWAGKRAGKQAGLGPCRRAAGRTRSGCCRGGPGPVSTAMASRRGCPGRTLEGSLHTDCFWGSIFIDQATHNGTRPNSPSGVKPARPLVGRYFMVQFREWVQLPRICSLPGFVVGPQSHQ